ncbi:MAG: VOC family protein [Caulobacteraceae bacterium]
MPDPAIDPIHALDAHVEAFVAEAIEGVELGGRLARDDVARLSRLAAVLAAGLADWRGALDALEVAPRAGFDERRAGALLLESVFDDLLAPAAWRVLAAALDLALKKSCYAGPLSRRAAVQATFTYAIKFVADMDKAVAFYRDTLGLAVKFASPFWSEFATGDVTLALHPASDANPAGGVQLGFTTADLPALYAAREAAGIDFVAPPMEEHGTLLSRIRDSEGAQVSLSGAR